MPSIITFGVKCQKGVYPLPSVNVVFTLLDSFGNLFSPLTQIRAISDVNGKAKAVFRSVSVGDYKVKAEIPINDGCGIKYVISEKISIKGQTSNINCYRWDIYTYDGTLLKAGTSQPDLQNPLITYIDYTGIAPGNYKIKIWDCNKSCDSNLQSFSIIDNSLPVGLDPEGWKEIQLV